MNCITDLSRKMVCALALIFISYSKQAVGTSRQEG